MNKIYLPVLIALFAWQLMAGPAQAAFKCTRLVKTLGGEVLVNSCNSCRIVKIQRKRPSSSAPINRTYPVAAKTKTGLSFRGPGQSTILSDTPCRPTSSNAMSGEAPNVDGKTARGDGKRCIILRKTQVAGISGLAVANICKECRMAVIDRINAKGERRSEKVAIAARSMMPIASLGAMQAAILDDKSCK